MNRRPLAASFALALLPSVALAQVPPGHGVRFTHGANAPGIEIVDLWNGGTAVPVNGLAFTNGFTCGAIHPITGDIWAGESSTGGRLLRITLVGNQVVSHSSINQLGGLSDIPLRSIAFDSTGDVFVNDYNAIYKVDRNTMSVTHWSNPSLGTETLRVLTIDPLTDRLWAASSGIIPSPLLLEYDLAAGPFSTPSVSTLGGHNVTGLEFDGDHRLFVGNIHGTGLIEYDLDTGLSTISPFLQWSVQSHCFWDSSIGVLHTASNVNGGATWRVFDLDQSTFAHGPTVNTNCPTTCFQVSNIAVAPSIPMGTAYCSGEGTACPCSNPGIHPQGCQNSTGSGAELTIMGAPSAGLDVFHLTGSHLPPRISAIALAGSASANGGNGAVFGDGVRCAGGILQRIAFSRSDAVGVVRWSGGFSINNGWQAGETRQLQVLYRDPVNGPCGNGFNLSNAVELSLVP